MNSIAVTNKEAKQDQRTVSSVSEFDAESALWKADAVIKMITRIADIESQEVEDIKMALSAVSDQHKILAEFLKTSLSDKPAVH